MAEKRMVCWNCPRYSRTELTCLDGKTNPKKKVDAVAAAEVLGLRALCHYSPYRDGLALRMHFPTTQIAIATISKKRRRGSKGKIEIEIEETETT
jgi:hypothetical protein